MDIRRRRRVWRVIGFDEVSALQVREKIVYGSL